MQNEKTSQDLLEALLSSELNESAFADLVVKEILGGSLCTAFKWVYPIAVSYLAQHPNDLRWKDQEEEFDGYYRVESQTSRFADCKPEPSVRAVDIASLSIEPNYNPPAQKWSKLVILYIYNKIWHSGIIIEMARAHMIAVHGWDSPNRRERTNLLPLGQTNRHAAPLQQ